ncbi:MAG: hypothetical protein AAB229_00260 [Candidatus Hydrogenedentota bacterium]
MEYELDTLDLRYERLRRRDRKKESRLLISLAEIGQQFPIVFVLDPAPLEAQVPIVVDGYKRVRALKKLGRDTIRGTRWDVCEVEAVMLEALMRREGSDGPLEEAWRLQDLSDRCGMSAVELARRFDRSASWVSRRLGLVKTLPTEVQEEVRDGRIGAYAAMKYLVPLARANRRDAARLTKTIAPLSISARQMREVYVAYTGANKETREKIIENPALFLRACDESKAPTIEPTAGRVLLDDLGIIEGVARRLHKKLREGIAQRVLPEERDEVVKAVAQTEVDVTNMGVRLLKEFNA